MTAVDFADATLVRLADPAQRAALFDDLALAQLTAAAYEVELDDLAGPYAATFDAVTLGVAMSPLVRLDGTARVTGQPTVADVSLQVSGLAVDAPRVDALWQGTITAHTPVYSAPVTSLTTATPAWPSLAAIDAELVALGGVPTDPQQREQARRRQLVAHVAAALPRSTAFVADRADEVAAAWLVETDSTDVPDMLARADALAATVTYGDPMAKGALPRTLPVSAALLLRDAGFSVAQLVSDSKQLAPRLADLGLARPPGGALTQRVPVVVTWVVPSTVFDDGAWPGATSSNPTQANAERRTTTGRWLAREGIGLVTVVPS